MSDDTASVETDPARSQPAGGRTEFIPLSRQLEAIVTSQHRDAGLTLNELLKQTAERGPFGLIILLCLPFLGPVSIPGASNVFGVVIALLAWGIFRGHPPKLPGRIGARSIEGKILARVIRASIRVLRWVERMTRPRGSNWIRSAAARRFNALVLVFGGLLLAAPIPPIVPLSNFTPAVGIILVSAAMMEEDGVVICYGYAATLAAALYITALIVIEFAVIVGYSDSAIRYLRGLFS